jgi:hypothetical protein
MKNPKAPESEVPRRNEWEALKRFLDVTRLIDLILRLWDDWM